MISDGVFVEIYHLPERGECQMAQRMAAMRASPRPLGTVPRVTNRALN